MSVNEPSTLLRFLDTGAAGVLVPAISSGQEAEMAVQAVKYHPRGRRGLAGVRAAHYSQREPLAEYIRTANAETMIITQVETAAGVQNLITTGGPQALWGLPTVAAQNPVPSRDCKGRLEWWFHDQPLRGSPGLLKSAPSLADGPIK